MHRVAYGDLKLVLLSLLAEGPLSTHLAVQRISEATGGEYIPSTGSVYPRLQAMVVHGLAERHVLKRGSTFEITAGGHEYLKNRRDAVAEARSRMGL